MKNIMIIRYNYNELWNNRKELTRQTKFCIKPSTPSHCQAQTVEGMAGTDLLKGKNKGYFLCILCSTAGCVHPKSWVSLWKRWHFQWCTTWTRAHSVCMQQGREGQAPLSCQFSSSFPKSAPPLCLTQLLIGSSLCGICLSSSKAGTNPILH